MGKQASVVRKPTGNHQRIKQEKQKFLQPSLLACYLNYIEFFAKSTSTYKRNNHLIQTKKAGPV